MRSRIKVLGLPLMELCVHTVCIEMSVSLTRSPGGN